MNNYQKEFDFFQTKGYSLIKGALSKSDLDRIREATEELKQGAKSMSNQVLFTHTDSPIDSPPLSTLMDQWLNPHRLTGFGSTSALALKLEKIASQFFREPMQIYQDLILSKNTSHDEFPWHQDAPYWPINFRQGATFWAPLCEVTESNGGLRIALDFQDKLYSAINLHTGERQDGLTGFNPKIIENPRLKPGDLLVIGSQTLHSSGLRNHGDERIAYASIFVDMDAKWDHHVAPNHPMCGETDHGALLSG